MTPNDGTKLKNYNMKKRKDISDTMNEGVQIAFQRLVIEKRKNDEPLVCSDENGKVVYVSAHDVVLEGEHDLMAGS